jgi:CO dehydrogenase maturation factor
VTDPSQRGVVAAQRVAELVTELNIGIGQAYVIVNRLPGGEMPAPLKAAVETIGVPLLGVIPADEALMEFEFSGRPLVELGDESPVYRAVAEMMTQILNGRK